MFSDKELQWKEVLTKIFQILPNKELKELLEVFPDLKKKNLTTAFKKDLPKEIIKRYGMDESFNIMKKVLDENYKMDKIKTLLSSFEDKPKKKEKVTTQ